MGWPTMTCSCGRPSDRPDGGPCAPCETAYEREAEWLADHPEPPDPFPPETEPPAETLLPAEWVRGFYGEVPF